MKCLRKYKWVKLHRACLPGGKGIMGYWARLASRAAFRKGNGLYCGHRNPVVPGMWTGGIVGLKSILGVKRRQQALKIMCELESMGYLTFDLDLRTKKLSYQITDWVMACAGAECMEGTVYATEGYGFLCMPRSITDRLVFNNRTFDEADAWLDLWCHTTYRDRGNAFSFLGPTVQFGKYASVLTLENLGRRWKWEKTKVWRFFKKYESVFSLYRLPGSFGCVIYNSRYIHCCNVKLPEESDVVTLFHEIRAASRKGILARSSVERINRMVAWNSWKVIKAHEEADENESGKSRVAPVRSYTRAYFSHGRNCKYGRNCIYDCAVTILGEVRYIDFDEIGVVCLFEISGFKNDTS